jgi:hypothetical protein
VFHKILGIPAHPLIIHAAVVFIPLLVVGAIVYSVWPKIRGRIDWAVGALGIIAPLAAFGAVESGVDFRTQLIGSSDSGALAKNIDQHESYGHDTLWWTIALGVLTVVVVVYRWHLKRTGGTEHALVNIGSAVVLVALSIVVGYYVFRTGDTGAHMVWGQSP